MANKNGKMVWMKVPQKPQKPKFDANEKERILKQVQEKIDHSDKLQKKVSRVAMRSNWVYLYELVEPIQVEGAVFIKPLIDGKYFEVTYARLTLNDNAGTDCTLDWQRHNEEWMSIHEGTLQECLDDLENDDDWFI
jgi:hypothetical protein